MRDQPAGQNKLTEHQDVKRDWPYKIKEIHWAGYVLGGWGDTWLGICSLLFVGTDTRCHWECRLRERRRDFLSVFHACFPSLQALIKTNKTSRREESSPSPCCAFPSTPKAPWMSQRAEKAKCFYFTPPHPYTQALARKQAGTNRERKNFPLVTEEDRTATHNPRLGTEVKQ